MTETMQEIEDIFDSIFKHDTVSKEECAEAQTKFQMTFLTLEKKEDFLTFLNTYSSKLLDQYGSEDDRVNALKLETERFFDNIPNVISMYRIGSHRDPNEKDHSEVISKDIDNSFDEINKLGNLGNLDGIVIPEEHKPTVTKVLQNLSILHDQKQATKVQFITKWRYTWLAEKINTLKGQIPAVFTIQKYVNRKYNVFHTFRKLALQDDKKSEKRGSDLNIARKTSLTEMQKTMSFSDKKPVEKFMTYTSNIVDKKLNRKLTSSMISFNGENTNPPIPEKNDRKSLLKINPSMTGLNLENDIFAEYTQKLKEKEESIRQLKEEIKKLTPSKITIAQSTIKQDVFDEQLKTYKGKILALETRILELNRDSESKRNLLNEQFNQLLEKKLLTEKQIAEIKNLKSLLSKQTLNNFGKIRFFAKTMRSLTRGFLSNAMLKMLKRSLKAIEAIQNVGLRMKARLLDQTRQLNCGKDMHRNFLKWFIRSDNSVLREHMSKILINCKINNNIAIYRLKKLIQKPSRNKLSDAIKQLHRCKGSILMHDLFSKRANNFKKNFLNAINPNFKTSKEALLEKVFLTNNFTHNKTAKKIIFDRLKKRLTLEKKAIVSIFNYWKLKQNFALKTLKMLNANKKNVEKLAKFRNAASVLEKMCNRKTKEFFDKAKTDSKKFILQTFDKLVVMSKFKSLAVFNTLKKHNNLINLERTNSDFQTGLNDIKKKNLAFMLVSNLRRKVYFVLSNLRLFSQKEMQLKERRTQLGQRVLMNLSEKLKFLKSQTLKKLRNNKQKEVNLQKKKGIFFNLISNVQTQKKEHCFSVLKENFNQNENKKKEMIKNMSKVFSILAIKSKNKLFNTITILRKNNDILKQNEKNKQGFCFEKLKTMRNVSLKSAFQKLMKNSNELKSKIVENAKKQETLKLLCNKMKLKSIQTLRDLRSFTQVHNASKTAKQNKLTNIFKTIKFCQEKKQQLCFLKLNSLANNRKNEDQIKLLSINKFAKLVKKKCMDKISHAQFILKQNNDETKKNDLENKNRKKQLLNNFALKVEKLKKNCLDSLRLNNNRISQNCLQNKSKMTSLFSSLKHNTEEKLKKCLTKMKEHKNCETSKNNLKNQQIEKLIKKMLQNRRDDKIFGLKALELNKVKTGFADKTKNDKIQSFFDKLLKSNAKKHVAFDKLVSSTKILTKNQKNKESLISRTLQRIVKANIQKTHRSLIVLHHLKNFQQNSENIEKLKNKYNDSLINRKKKGLMMLLISSQNAKQQNVLKTLLRKLNEKKLDEAKKRDRNRNRLQKVIDNLNHKMNLAFQKLINNKEYLTRLEKEKEAKKNKIASLLSSSISNKEQSQFDAFINQLKKQEKPKPKDFHFDSFCDYLKDNNRRGIYDKPLSLIEQGNIQGLTDLLNFATENNENHVYDDLIKRINDKNREAHDLLDLLKRTNVDGQYSNLIELLKNAPKMTKTDIINLIASNNEKRDYDQLKAHLNGDKKIDNLIVFMRQNNKDGKYDRALGNIKRLKTPKMSDLINFLQIDKNNDYSDLKKEINKEDDDLTSDKLITLAHSSNENGKLNNLLKFAEEERIPTVVDLYKCAKTNDDKNGNIAPIVEFINSDTIDPKVAQFCQLVESKIPNVEFQKLIKFVKNKNNCKLSDVLSHVSDNRSLPDFENLVKIIDDLGKCQKYLDFLKKNNKNHEFDEILNFFEKQKNPKFSDFLENVGKNFENVHFGEIIELIKQDKERIEEIRNLLNSKKADKDFAALRTHLEMSTSPNLFTIVDFISKNNKNGALQPVLDLINQQIGRPILEKTLNSLIKRNINGKYDPILTQINSTKSPKLSEIINLCSNSGLNDKIAPVFLDINSEQSHFTNDLCDSLESKNNDAKFNQTINSLRSLPNPTLTRAIKNLIQAKDEPGITAFDSSNIFNNQIIFMKKNNQDGLYSEILNHLEKIKNPKIEHLFKFCNKNNQSEKLKHLLENVNSQIDRSIIYDIIKKNPETFKSLNEFQNEHQNWKADEIFDFIAQKNDKQENENDLILDILNGNCQLKTVPELYEFLKKNNQNGKNDQLILKVAQMEDPKISQIVIEVLKDNDSHKHDDVFDFLDGKSNNEVSEEVRFMRNNNADKQFNQILDLVEKGKITKKSQLIDLLSQTKPGNNQLDLVDMINNPEKRNILHSALKLVRNENKNGLYNDISKEIKPNKNLDLISMSNIVFAKNNANKFPEIAKLIDENKKDKLVKAIIDFAKENNKNGEYSGFLEHLRLIKDPRLLDITDYLHKNNENDNLQPLFELINGNSFPSNKMLNFLLKNNKDGRYDELINMLSKDPNTPLEKILDYIKKNNKNGEMDPFLKYLGNGCHEIDDLDDVEPDDLFKFLANARRKNQYPELLELMKTGAIKNNQGLLDYLNQNNKNGQYNDLIEHASKFLMKDQPVEARSESHGISLEKPSKSKMLACLKKLREVGKELGLKNHIKSLKMNNILRKMIHKHHFKVLSCFNKFNENNKNNLKKDRKHKKVMNSILNNFGSSKNDKMKKVFDILRENNLKKSHELEKKNSTTRFLISRLLVGSKNKQLQALKSMIFKGKNDKTKIIDLFQKLKNSCSQKKIQSVHKLNSISRFLKEHTKNRVQFIAMLEKAQKGKLTFSLLKLIKSNNLEKAEKLRLQNLKAHVALKLGNDIKSKLNDAFYKLKLNNHKERHVGNINQVNKSSVIKKLILKTSLKLKLAFISLLHTHTLSNVQKTLLMKTLQNGIKKLKNNSDLKLKECLQNLMKNNTLVKNEKIKTSKASGTLFSKLVFGCLAKKRQCFGILQSNSKNEQIKQESLQNKTKTILGKLHKNLHLLLKLAFNKLSSNRQIIAANKNQKDKEKMSLKFFESQIAKNKKTDLTETFKNLRKINQNYNNTKKKEENAIKSIISLNLKNKNKILENAFKSLKENQRAINEKQLKKGQLCDKLLKKLVKSTKSKMENVVQNLRNQNIHEGLKNSATQAEKKRILSKMLTQSQAKLRKNYEKLKNHQIINKQNELKKRNIVKGCCENIVNNQNKLLASAFAKIQANNVSQIEFNRKKDRLVQRIVDKLALKAQAKERLFLTGEFKRLISNKSKDNVKTEKMKSIFGKLMAKKKLSCFEKLIMFSLLHKIRFLKRKEIISKQKNMSLVKSALVIGKLNNFKNVSRLKFAFNSKIFCAVINALTNKRKTLAMNALSKNMVKTSSERSNVVKFIQKSISGKMRNAYQKLKSVNDIFKRNKLNNALSSMMFCLKKNHKVCMRKMLDVWSQKELKVKTQKLTNCLNHLLTKRVGYAMSKIKYEYGIWKYQKVLKSLLNLIETVENRQFEIKRKSFTHLYGMFMDNNPWFKKVINILAINSRLSDQVSFWRMRYAKNLKREGLTPLQAIKLKQLAQLFRRQETKNLSYGLWNLMKIADLGISRRQNSILSK